MEKVQAKHRVTAAFLAVAGVATTGSTAMQAGNILIGQAGSATPGVAAYVAAGALAAAAVVGTGSIVAYALIQDDRDVAGLNEERIFEASQLPPSRTVLTPVNRTTRIFSQRSVAQSAQLRLARSA